MRLPEIIGVAGTNGAGKDTLARLRATHESAKDVSLSDILRGELDTRGLTHERENLRAVGNELRAAHGPGVLAIKAMEAYREENGSNGLSLSSIRSVGEAEAIVAAGGVIVWIDADPKVRYQRVTNRPGARPTDQKSYDQFLEEEAAEMHPPKGQEDDKSVLNMAGVKELATIFVTNEFETVEAYEDYLKREFEIN